jgi:hypothetical protein
MSFIIWNQGQIIHAITEKSGMLRVKKARCCLKKRRESVRIIKTYTTWRNSNGMSAANGQANTALNLTRRDIRAGVAGARVVSAACALEHLLAMRMRQHAERVDAVTPVL